ncbi:hypothetical protein ACWA2C_16495 [Priestia megaterium]
MKTFKYCSAYRCGRVLPEEHDNAVCPYCGSGYESVYSSHTQIKPLPEVAYTIEMKCSKTGETNPNKLCYSKQHVYGSFTTGNEFESAESRKAFYDEMDRQEAMNYLVIEESEDNITFHENKEDLEKEFDRILKDCDYEYLQSTFEDMVILKVEKVTGSLKSDDFHKRNMLFYNYEWYRVEEVIQPEFEADSDFTVSW